MNAVVIMIAEAAIASLGQAPAFPGTDSTTIVASSASSSGHVLGPLALQPQDPSLPLRSAFWMRVQAHHDHLKPSKKLKALFTRDFYNRMLVIMLDPMNTANDTSQFRFWTRKMRLDQQGRITKDRKPVAVWEDFYDIIADAHKRVKHSGRDKTWTVLSKKWAKLPKELVTQFVELCPTCAPQKTNINRAPRKPKLSSSDDDGESTAPLPPRTSCRADKKSYRDSYDSDDGEDGDSFVQAGEGDDEDHLPENGLDPVARAAEEVLANGPRVATANNPMLPPLNSEMAIGLHSLNSVELPVPPAQLIAHPPSSYHLSPLLSSNHGTSSSRNTAPAIPGSLMHSLPYPLSAPYPYTSPPMPSASTGTYNELESHPVMATNSTGAAYDPFTAFYACPPRPVPREHSPALELSDYINLGEEGDGGGEDEVEIKPDLRRNSPTTLQAASTLASLHPAVAPTHDSVHNPSPSSPEQRPSTPAFLVGGSSHSSQSSRTRTSSARDEEDDLTLPAAKRAFFA
ncbi:hypothetical protein JCM11251_001768 [Rhodosporidiobolus azoricus]